MVDDTACPQGHPKTADNYRRTKRGKNVGTPYCLICKREKGKVYREGRSESQRERDRLCNLRYQSWRYKMLRAAAFVAYGAACSCCGETIAEFLQIDHVANDGKAHRTVIGEGSFRLVQWLALNNYPAGFQLLCANCHVAKTMRGRCPHAN